MLGKWAGVVYRRPWLVLAFGVVLVALAVVGLVTGSMPSASITPTDTEAATERALANQELPAKNYPSFSLIFRDPDLTVSDPTFQSWLGQAVQPLRSDWRVRALTTPYDRSPTAPLLVSRDRHEALVVVQLSDMKATFKTYDQVQARVGLSGPLQVLRTGTLAVDSATATQGLHDIGVASGFSLPLTAIVLLIVLGTVVAAAVPLGVGTLAVLTGTSALFVLASFVDITSGATELLALMGLGVGIDCSLFIVSRFREQLSLGSDPADSLEVAMATAGRTVVFSGLAVILALSSMLSLWHSAVGSMGIAGSLGVLSAVVYALTVLPAVLALLDRRINFLRPPIVGRPPSAGGIWQALASGVMRRPLLSLLAALLICGALAFPVHALQLGPYGIAELPPDSQARQNLERLVNDFPSIGRETIPVLLNFPGDDVTSLTRQAYAHELASHIAGLPGVVAVDDPTAPGSPSRQASIGSHVLLLTVSTSVTSDSRQAKSLVSDIRRLTPPRTGRLLVGGQTATDADSVAWIEARAPWAAAYVLVATYVVIFLLVGSVFLPLKAVLSNLLSVGASFGVVVWIFQEGHFSQQLDFTPQTLDPTVAVLIFSILFGLSTDYEVLMLSRIQEYWRRSGDTADAVARGLASSGRLITGAGAVMVAVFASFGLAARELPLQELGIGMSVAVALDATVVRILIVPAVVRLLGSRSWWAPAWLVGLRGRFWRGEAETDLTQPGVGQASSRPASRTSR